MTNRKKCGIISILNKRSVTDMQNFVKLLEELKTRPIRISDTKKGWQVQQTDRNKMKADLQQAILADLKEMLEVCAIVRKDTKTFVGFEIPNSSGSGAITVMLDFTIMGLDNSFDELENEYKLKQEEKAEKDKEKAEKKKQKIARDTAERQKKDKGGE